MNYKSLISVPIIAIYQCLVFTGTKNYIKLFDRGRKYLMLPISFFACGDCLSSNFYVHKCYCLKRKFLFFSLEHKRKFLSFFILTIEIVLLLLLSHSQSQKVFIQPHCILFLDNLQELSTLLQQNIQITLLQSPSSQ